MSIGDDGVKISRVPRETQPGVRTEPFSLPIQKHMLELYREKYPVTHPTGPVLMADERYVAPEGYSDHYHHIKNWIEAIRSRQPVVEDPVYGFRAAGAALLSNLSFETGQPARWDPEAMKLL